jgi:hypothetical protein
MYQVTAIYQGSEIGYGEGSGYQYAIEECIDSIDSMYTDNVLEEITLTIHMENEKEWVVMVTDFFHKEKQYF